MMLGVAVENRAIGIIADAVSGPAKPSSIAAMLVGAA
jgi:hypothetical protein